MASIALARPSGHLVQAGLFVWILLAYVFCGLLAWTRRPESGFGRLMVVVGFGAALSNLAWSANPVLFTVGQAVDLLVVALFLHVFLAFPSGRVAGPARVVVVVAYAISIGLQLTVMLLGGFGDGNLLAITDAPGAANAVHAVELVTLSGLLLVGVGLLGVRLGSQHRAVRWLVGSFALGLVALAVLLVMGLFVAAGFTLVQRLTLFVLGLAPVAFLAGLLDARLARASVGDLVVELRAEPDDLTPALVRALRDPTASLLYWLPQYRSWVDHDGSPVTLPASATLIPRDGEPVAALVHHPSVEAELVRAVAAAVEMVIDNARLRAELRARLSEVRASRARVIEAGRTERRRLERDLHDGAQQRLVGLSLRLGLLESHLDGDPAVRQALAEARAEVATSLSELRDLAHGLYPAVLSGHGLAVALESVAAQATVPVRLDVRLDDRLPEPVEVAAYYVVCESLTNVGRHANASSASVEVAPARKTLVVEVSDDGAGGADTASGSGLRGLADRVEALGGTLRVWSPAGGGTRVRAELPCG
ncbi:sensor histidine kinase [Actinoplanes sp. Pm04-4]|uniref:histidine kinase n=1 Tax=Paractinoplanes pyxinae TaxID=2997416 RepID=A0ABT4AYI0_9ACTN|nr:sensor histidine kinase [Actinoplanes pyxinae]MCY1139298.1 sensor histidine kinase [Actinoplanes pyxinae]